MIHIQNESETRPDLARRHETKYVLRRWDVDQVRHALLQHTRRQVHNQPVSVVRSIYFDDARLSACQANVGGLGRRRKLRIRWYDQLAPGELCYMEIKWRDNRTTGKHRLRLDSSRPLADLTYRELADRLRHVVPETFLDDFIRFSDPIVMVEYKRQHFVSRDGKARLTIDYDICFYDQQGRRGISTRFPLRHRDLAVLEAKTHVDAPCRLSEYWAPLALRSGRCSKYVTGCQMLGLIDGSV